MARVPVLERAFGQDRLARQHRLVGFTSFNLMLAHVVLITWGYAAGELRRDAGDAVGADRRLPRACCSPSPAPSAWSWWSSPASRRPGGGSATSRGTCCTSTPTSASAWPCRTSCGPARSSSRSPGATVFWWGLWAAAAGAVLVWRVGPAAVAQRAAPASGSPSVVPEGDGVVSVYMTGRRLDRLRRRGRAVLHLALPRPGPAGPAAHPYSLSAAPDGRSLRITVKELGDGSAALRHVRPGTRVLVEGPYGRLSARARTRPKVAFIGAGVGITPLRALAEELDYAPGRRRPAVPVQRPAAVRRGARRPRPGARSARCVWLPGRRRAPGLLARRRRRRGRRPHRADRTGCPTSPSATSTSAARSLGRGRPRAPPRPPASPPTASTSRASDGDPSEDASCCGS